MSLPRQIVPGATYLITRRCTQRQFLLAPSAAVNAIFCYCLAVAASRTGMLIHPFVVMSNHYHLIVTDPYGRLPEFCGLLHQLVARYLNFHLDRRENFWASEQASYVRLVGPEDVLAKTVYVLANPVAAGLVARGRDWPGLRVYTPGRRHFKRPPGFFRQHGPMPEEVSLDITLPPIGAANPQEALEQIEAAVAHREAEHRAVFKQEGRSFLGLAGIRAQRPTDTPSSREPRRELSPRIACRNPWRRIEVLRRCKQFIADYREALRRWRLSRDAVFPFGTYQMALRHAVAVAPAPS